jgi:hypothetical protein
MKKKTFGWSSVVVDDRSSGRRCSLVAALLFPSLAGAVRERPAERKREGERELNRES